MYKIFSMVVQPIPRWKRISDFIWSFNTVGPFKTKDEALHFFIVLFDQNELKAKEHNEKVRNGSMETVYMSVPVPTQHHQYTNLHYSIATKHIVIFSDWGAVAMYRKIEGVYDDIAQYKNNPLALPLIEKKSFCERSIWD